MGKKKENILWRYMVLEAMDCLMKNQPVQAYVILDEMIEADGE